MITSIIDFETVLYDSTNIYSLCGAYIIWEYSNRSNKKIKFLNRSFFGDIHLQQIEHRTIRAIVCHPVYISQNDILDIQMVIGSKIDSEIHRCLDYINMTQKVSKSALKSLGEACRYFSVSLPETVDITSLDNNVVNCIGLYRDIIWYETHDFSQWKAPKDYREIDITHHKIMNELNAGEIVIHKLGDRMEIVMYVGTSSCVVPSQDVGTSHPSIINATVLRDDILDAIVTRKNTDTETVFKIICKESSKIKDFLNETKYQHDTENILVPGNYKYLPLDLVTIATGEENRVIVNNASEKRVTDYGIVDLLRKKSKGIVNTENGKISFTLMETDIIKEEWTSGEIMELIKTKCSDSTFIVFQKTNGALYISDNDVRILKDYNIMYNDRNINIISDKKHRSTDKFIDNKNQGDYVICFTSHLDFNTVIEMMLDAPDEDIYDDDGHDEYNE